MSVSVIDAVRNPSRTATRHNSAQYLAQEQAEGRAARPIDCYAIAGGEIWVRMEVVCEPDEAGSYRYVVGFWGQLLTATKGPAPQSVPQT